MPPERSHLDQARKWLRYARNDLLLAGIDRPAELMWEPLAFHAQQAVEKAFKAVLASRAVDFPPTHNLTVLRELMPTDIVLPAAVSDAVELTVYAVASRYPEDMDDVTEADYRKAIEQAGAALEWAERMLGE